MKYLIKDTDTPQKMNDLFSQIKESIAQLQEMVAEFEQEQFAGYIQKSPATAQKILNSNVLQEYGIAYRVGNTWNINVESLVARLDKMGKS